MVVSSLEWRWFLPLVGWSICLRSGPLRACSLWRTRWVQVDPPTRAAPASQIPASNMKVTDSPLEAVPGQHNHLIADLDAAEQVPYGLLYSTLFLFLVCSRACQLTQSIHPTWTSR